MRGGKKQVEYKVQRSHIGPQPLKPPLWSPESDTSSQKELPADVISPKNRAKQHTGCGLHLSFIMVSPPSLSPENGLLCVKISKKVIPREYTSLAALYGPSSSPCVVCFLCSQISGAMNSRVPQIEESPYNAHELQKETKWQAFNSCENTSRRTCVATFAKPKSHTTPLRSVSRPRSSASSSKTILSHLMSL